VSTQVIFGPDNRDYSADYPGEMRKTVEAAFPGSTCFFLQGGCGDINPYYRQDALDRRKACAICARPAAHWAKK
jgi:hypothetical protein